MIWGEMLVGVSEGQMDHYTQIWRKSGEYMDLGTVTKLYLEKHYYKRVKLFLELNDKSPTKA